MSRLRLRTNSLSVWLGQSSSIMKTYSLSSKNLLKMTTRSCERLLWILISEWSWSEEAYLLARLGLDERGFGHNFNGEDLALAVGELCRHWFGVLDLVALGKASLA